MDALFPDQESKMTQTGKRVWLLVFCTTLFGCNAENGDRVSANQEGTIHAVCTTGMVADLVRNVGGDRVHVDQLMGQDVDPHLFKAALEDIGRLQKADLIFYSGLHLEGKMAEILEKLSKKRPSFAVADFIDPKRFLTDENQVADPHLWFDVSLWAKGVTGIGKALAEFNAKNAADYQKRAKSYRTELDQLHLEVKSKIASIPPTRRVLVTSHDAFRYFSRAYDIEVKSIQGISTEAEASVQRINELVEFISRRGVKAVFVESSVNERNMDAVLEGCKARGHAVSKGGTLFSDAMGKTGAAEGTYPGMVRHNVDTIVRALK